MNDYTQDAKGKTIVDLKENQDFQKDLVRFLSSSRKNYSTDELRKKGVDFMVDEYVEHMRKQDTNEATALKDLFFAKDKEAREDDRAAFGRLMQTWDNVEGVGTGKLKGAGDYLEGVLTSPATLAGVFTGGFTKLAGMAAVKSTQIATRLAVKKILSKQFAKEAAKGFGVGAVVEGAVGYGQIEAQEGAREATIENYEGMSVGQKALATGLNSAFGGITSGFSRGMMVKQADQVSDALTKQSLNIAADKKKFAKKAVSNLNSVATAQGRKKINGILNRMNGLVSVLEQRDLKKLKLTPLDPDKVAKGADLKSTILTEGPNKNVTTGLSKHTLQGITAAALDLSEKIKLDLEDPSKRISSALADALEAGTIATKEVNDIIANYGLTKEEFSYIFLSDLSEAGRVLGQAGMISRKIKKDTLSDIVNKMENFSEQGITTFNEKLSKEISAAVGVESKIPKPLMALYEGLKASDSVRIAFMTSQLGTTAANTMFSTARLGIDVFEEATRQTLVKGYQFATGNKVPRSTLYAATSTLRAMSWNKQDAMLAKEMFARDFPEEYQKIFYDINRAEVSVGSDTRVGKMGSFVNSFNSAVDTRFKQAAFYASLDRQLIDSGSSLKEFLSKGNSLLDLPNQDMKEKAVYDSLDFVFQKGYKRDDAGGIPKALIDYHRKLPFVVSGVLGIPFPRYVANHIEFINDYTPVGIMTGAFRNFDKMYANPLKDTSTRLARQITGVTLLSGAYMARASQVEFDEEGKATLMKTKFSDISFGDEGETKKMGRTSGPLVAHYLIADLMVRLRYDLPVPKKTEIGRDTLEVLGGLGNMGFDKGLSRDISSALDSGEWGGLRTRLADVASTFTYPTTVLRDMQGQIDPESGYMPYTRSLMLGDGVQKEVNFLDAIVTETESFNRLVRMLPEYNSALFLTDTLQYTQTLDGKKAPTLFDPIGGGPVRSINPITKQLLGIESKKTPNTLQKNINNLGLKEFLLYGKKTVKNAHLDYMVRGILSKTMNKDFEDYISKPLKEYNKTRSWEDLTANEQRDRLQRFIRGSITTAENMSEQYFNELVNNSPKSAAGYIRNAYALDTSSNEIKKFSAQNLSGGEFDSPDDYINDSTSIEVELERRMELMQLNSVQSKQIN